VIHLLLFSSETGLQRVEFGAPTPQLSWQWNGPVHASVEEWLDAYREKYWIERDLPLCWPSQSPFAQQVYQCMAQIRAGTCSTYGELARLAGHPGAARAVGTHCRRNPFPLLIPCHRITAAHGLGGYAGGLSLKQQLLEWEGANVREHASH
jgi:methylated-DNA-[protein]-cysteine S-methyltransferase